MTPPWLAAASEYMGAAWWTITHPQETLSMWREAMEPAALVDGRPNPRLTSALWDVIRQHDLARAGGTRCSRWVLTRDYGSTVILEVHHESDSPWQTAVMYRRLLEQHGVEIPPEDPCQ